MVDSRQKGARGETIIRDELRELTGLKWERVPGSGALDPKHGLKGDLYIPNSSNFFCIEVKNYAEDQVTSKLLTGSSPTLISWWEQAVRQAEQINKKPLLIFKFDRSKIFVAFSDFPNNDSYKYLYLNINNYMLYVALLRDWVQHEHPEFT